MRLRMIYTVADPKLVAYSSFGETCPGIGVHGAGKEKCASYFEELGLLDPVLTNTVTVVNYHSPPCNAL